jgi:hypothetical protein
MPAGTNVGITHHSGRPARAENGFKKTRCATYRTTIPESRASETVGVWDQAPDLGKGLGVKAPEAK